MQTAEECARELANLARVMNPWGYGEHDWHAPIAVIESRDTAIREAAKRELLAEIRRDVAVLAGHGGCARGYEYNQTLNLLEAKYTPAADSQPAQDAALGITVKP